MSLTLNDISSGYSTGAINTNFQKLEQYINESLLNRDNLTSGEPNQMENALDMNGNPILNVGSDPFNPEALLTVGTANGLFVNVSGDTMQGSLNMDAYPIFVRIPQGPTEPVRKDVLDSEIVNRQAADASLQNQIVEAAPIAAAERPIIQWHAQQIDNSATIPEDVNAFTVGPTFRIAVGQTVTVGDGSFWTILNGAESGNLVTATVDNFDEGTL